MNGFLVFLSLLVGHLLADFPLQTDTVYRLRQKGWHGLLLHAGIHVAVAALLIHGLIQQWWLLLALGALHASIDALKPQMPVVRRPHARFLVDQALHVLSLSLVAWLARDLHPVLSAPWLYGLAAIAFMPALLMFLSILKQENMSLQTLLYREIDGPETPTLYHLAGWIPVVLVLLSQVHWTG